MRATPSSKLMALMIKAAQHGHAQPLSCVPCICAFKCFAILLVDADRYIYEGYRLTKVWRNLKGVGISNLRQICSQLLEIDVLGTTCICKADLKDPYIWGP